MTYAWIPTRGILLKLDDADLMESAEVFEGLGGVLTEDDLAEAHAGLEAAADDAEENDDP